MKQHLLVALLFAAVGLAAQDLHFSQATLAPLHQNPALAGVFEGDYRAGGNLRRQWKTVPIPYQTVSFFADGKLLDLGKTRLGGGLVFDSDQAGDGALSWSEIQLAGSVSRVLSQKSLLSAGFSVGMAQRSFDINGLKFKNQFIDGQFSASNDPLESGFNRSTGSILDFAAGLNFHFKNPKKSDVARPRLRCVSSQQPDRFVQK